MLWNFVLDIFILFAGLWRPLAPITARAHSLIVGTVIGALWGLAAHILLEKPMKIAQAKIRLDYQSGFLK